MPSKSILEHKQAVVAELAEKLKNSPAGVVVNYQGITVEDDTKMRRALREAGVEYTVLKNSLTGRACDEVGLSDMKQYLVGMTAIAVGTTDAVAPAKVLKEYAEKIESFQILAGYLDGRVVDEATVKQLADIPSKEVLIAKFLGSIKSPLYGLAYALQAVVDKGEEAPAAEAAPAAEEAAPATEEAPAAEAPAEA
ncbi:MAG: 50S ribosomal protein L10 [Clostridia bacterium]|nr:50S ribosomal protein L10 [Clostridia bacterium]